MSATLRITTDVTDSGSLDLILISETVANDRLIIHIGYNSASNTHTVGNHPTVIDEAVADDTMTMKEACDSSYACVISLIDLKGCILYAESIDRTGDNAKDTEWKVVVCCSRLEITITNSMSATIVITIESVIVIFTDECQSFLIQVDVGGLEEMDTGALIAFITVLSNLLQIRSVVDQERILGSTVSSERIESQAFIGVYTVVTEYTTATVVKHRIGVGLTGQVLIPGHAFLIRRFVVQQPCDLTARHGLITDVGIVITRPRVAFIGEL